MEPPPLISRKRHYFYVLVFSVAVWLSFLELLGGFIPLAYIKTRTYTVFYIAIYIFTNISYLVYGAGGLIAGLTFSYPIHRWMIVSSSKPDDKLVPLTWVARYGKCLLAWRGLLLLAIIASVYLLGDYISHRYYIVHPTLTTPGPDGSFTGFHYALMRGDYKTVENGLYVGIDVNLKGKSGATPLHYAIKYNHFEIAKLLLKKGAGVDAKDNAGKTPLHGAAKEGHLDVAKLLIENGAEVNSSDKRYKVTPIDLAISSGKTKLVQLLCENGAELNNPPIGHHGFSQSLLHFAAEIGEAEIVKLLIRHGADLNATDSNGHLPIHTAAARGNLEAVKALIKVGSDVDAYSLFLAALENRLEVTSFLIDRKSNVNAKNEKGETPLDWAIEAKHDKMINLLRSHGAKTGEEIREQGNKETRK